MNLTTLWSPDAPLSESNAKGWQMLLCLRRYVHHFGGEELRMLIV
jgi:hypothetical protein